MSKRCIYGAELDDHRSNWVQTQRLELVARTVVDEERGHESAGGERDVEADEHVGEARREDRLSEVLCPAVPDGCPGLLNCHYRVAKFTSSTLELLTWIGLQFQGILPFLLMLKAEAACVLPCSEGSSEHRLVE